MNKNQSMEMLKKLKSRELLITFFLIVVVAFLGVTTQSFFEWANISDILLNVSYVIVAGIGMTMIIITGNIDVSAGALLATLSMVLGGLVKAGVPMWIGFIAVIVLGVVLGMIPGYLVGYMEVPAIIATLGISNIYRGLIVAITDGAWIHDLPQKFNLVGKGELWGIPIPAIIAIAAVAAGSWFMRNTRFGRGIYAVGSDASAAVLSGIDAKKTILGVYMIMGGIMGLATIIYATRFLSVQSNSGTGFEMMVIAATIVGGTNILGGSGNISGTMVGALLLGVIRTGLVLLRISSYWEQTVQGMVILLAVVAGLYDYYSRRMSKLI